jgi:hypothetical protein
MNLEEVLKNLYTKENVETHVKDYEQILETKKYCKTMIKFCNKNIACFKFYKAICFTYYRLHSKLLSKILLVIYKTLIDDAVDIGGDL